MRHIASNRAPTPGGPYSHAVEHAGLIYLSGQRPVDPSDASIPEGFEAQARQVLINLQAVLADAGAELSDVVKVSAYLADIGHFDSWNEVYRQFFAHPYPARTTVACELRGVLVEVDVVAAASARRQPGARPVGDHDMAATP
jgi:2-iminobutanoate/2-iminopropanoate deaminase